MVGRMIQPNPESNTDNEIAPPHNVSVNPLLSRMAVGASQAMFSLEAWQTQLDGVPGGAEFMAQLQREWLPADPPDAFCAQLGETCKAHIAAWHTGWPNLWAHILRVTGYALRIAPEVGVPPDQAYALAVLHDVGKLEEMRTGEPHTQYGAHFARQQLAGHYTRPIMNAIAGAIGKEGQTSDTLAHLLYDADKLDKIGAAGIVRRVSLTIRPERALSMVERVTADLQTFPPLKHRAAEQMALVKRTFTASFIASLQVE